MNLNSKPMSGSLQTPCSPGALHEQSWLQAHVLSLNPCLRLRQEGLHLLLLIHKIALGEHMVLVLSWCLVQLWSSPVSVQTVSAVPWLPGVP